MLHTILFPSRQCRIVLPHLEHNCNITKHQVSTSAHLFKAKFDLSDDLTNGPHDLIGPPRPASNLRPVKFAVRKDLPVYIKSCLLLLRCEKASLPLRRGWEVWGRRHRSLTRTGGQSTTGSSSRAGKILSRIFWRPSILMSLTSQHWVQMRCHSSTGTCHSRHPAFISHWLYSPPIFPQYFREFMNRQWKGHVEYNKEWQKRNWTIIFLSARVKLQRLLDRGRWWLKVDYIADHDQQSFAVTCDQKMDQAPERDTCTAFNVWTCKARALLITASQNFSNLNVASQ